MREGLLHIRDVEGSKKTGSMEARLEAMEQQVFKCQGMVERGLNANHMMITEFTNKHKIDANDIGKHLSRLYDKIDHLQAQIYDLQNQNYDLHEDANALLLHIAGRPLELLQLSEGGVHNSHVLDGGVINGITASQLLADGATTASHVRQLAGPGASRREAVGRVELAPSGLELVVRSL
ncbi:40S ribosomal protein S5-1 [Hordeum vulgare]|nr:40S ribosomal protein S5-1 [Hordeum vulgare]